MVTIRPTWALIQAESAVARRGPVMPGKTGASWNSTLFDQNALPLRWLTAPASMTSTDRVWWAAETAACA
ncbi:MAG TPA: hypothetical protein DCP73_03435, partial [Chloroflexi bacterium]|nr:hypothetical protein [Chloroflexota bacterium]